MEIVALAEALLEALAAETDVCEDESVMVFVITRG
jgi:hypothetical protein